MKRGCGEIVSFAENSMRNSGMDGSHAKRAAELFAEIPAKAGISIARHQMPACAGISVI
jgi:hypothetical protein